MKLLNVVKRKLFGEDWGPGSMRLPSAWRKAAGAGVRVLVIDTGAPESASVNRLASKNFVWDEGVNDLNGHATSVCGIIRDWAPLAEVVCYKALDRDGHIDGCMAVLAALRAAADVGDFRVVNISLAAYRGASKLREPIREIVAAGGIVVAGAGNEPGKGLAFPARWPEVVAVGARDRHGAAAEFSPAGADCLMPGVDIRAPWRSGHRVASGTSLAAAAASGLLALALSAGLDASEARAWLETHGRV